MTIVQVDHDVDALACGAGAAPGSCATPSDPASITASTVAEAALNAGCHYIDTGGEAPWVRLAHEEWGAKFAEADLLLAPATAYMSAVAEACARIAIERAPGIDSLEILSMFMGFPTYGSHPDHLRPAPVGVDLPRAERVPGMAAGDARWR